MLRCKEIHPDSGSARGHWSPPGLSGAEILPFTLRVTLTQ